MPSNLGTIDLPSRTLVVHIGVAALAAVGITSLTGSPAHPAIAVPVLTSLLMLALLRGTGAADSGRLVAGDSIATTDPLTEVATEAVGSEALDREFAAAQRGRPLTIVLVRLEALPKYRAQHGKAVADQLMRVCGRVLKRHRRGMRLAARYGGREGTFLSILSGSDREGGAVYAARLRRDLVRPPALPEHPGVSFGVASFDVSMGSPKELIRQAAFALEQSAAAGGKVMIVGAGEG